MIWPALISASRSDRSESVTVTCGSASRDPGSISARGDATRLDTPRRRSPLERVGSFGKRQLRAIGYDSQGGGIYVGSVDLGQFVVQRNRGLLRPRPHPVPTRST